MGGLGTCRYALDTSTTPTVGTVVTSGVPCPTSDTPPTDPAALRIYQEVEAAEHIIATSQSHAVRLFQLPSDNATYSSIVEGPSTSWSGASGSCAGCATDFRSSSPAAIEIGPATFGGQYCSGNLPLTVMTSGHLDALAAPSFADIVEINQSFGLPLTSLPPFTQQGAEMVAHLDGFAVDPTAVQPGYTRCDFVTPYHVEWYVNLQDLRLRGLRNFRIDPSELSCCNVPHI